MARGSWATSLLCLNRCLEPMRLHTVSAQLSPMCHFTAEKKVLKGQWSWWGEHGLGGERAGWALALLSAGPPVCSRLVLHNLLKGTTDLDAPREKKRLGL